jgi:hypothetical protein
MPVLGAPAAGVGRVNPDDRGAAPGRHADQPGTELCGGDTRDGAAQPFTTLAAAQSLTPGGARIGEIEVLDHNRRAAAVLGVIE